MWSGFAERYKREAPRVTGPAARVLADVALAVLGRTPEAVLDAGCGTGLLAEAMLERVPAGAAVDASDVAPDMVAAAEAALRGRARRVFEADGEDHERAPAEAYDVVASNFGLMVFSDPRHSARWALRALRPGGVFAFTVWHLVRGDSPYMTDFVDELRRLAGLPPDDSPAWRTGDELALVLRECGFVDVAVRGVCVTAAHDDPRAFAETMARSPVRRGALDEVLADAERREHFLDGAVEYLRRTAGGGKSPLVAIRRCAVVSGRKPS